MKFCKNLQRLIEISDPQWVPYWTNYKTLKKLINELRRLVSNDDNISKPKASRSIGDRPTSPLSMNSYSSQPPCKQKAVNSTEKISRLHMKMTTTTADQSPTLLKLLANDSILLTTAEVVSNLSVSKTALQITPICKKNEFNTNIKDIVKNTNASDRIASTSSTSAKKLGRSPAEVAFFKLLHSEVKKATRFFDKAEQEFSIREERIREGIEITKGCNRVIVSDWWSSVAKILLDLYKDLLLLETYAIMTYCSFSKILKKHDKVTGHMTRNAFMSNIVSKANFCCYPTLLEMIRRCEELYEEQICKFVAMEGKNECLEEDEELFINMINRLNDSESVHANRGTFNISECRNRDECLPVPIATVSVPYNNRAVSHSKRTHHDRFSSGNHGNVAANASSASRNIDYTDDYNKSIKYKRRRTS